MRPVLALLTDFGTRDHYVASMKAVILGIARDAAIVDITHEVPRQDVLAGALELEACVDAFPADTVFVAVVDPGVGSTRRAIAAEAGGWRFVGPDNGVLSLAIDRAGQARAVELADPRYARHVVSRTFEGRDRFAPAAAWLARGTALDALGPPVELWTHVPVPAVRRDGDLLEGEVVRVDRFGNLITNVPADAVQPPPAHLFVEGLDVPCVDTYAAAAAGALCALVGSSGRFEIAINGGSAAERLGLGRGARVAVPCGADGEV